MSHNEDVTATSVIENTTAINERAKTKFAHIVIDNLGRLGVDLSASKVLSAGCGTGAVSEVLAEETHSLTGFDFSSAGIRTLRNSNPSGRYIHASLPSIPFKSSKFDIVTAFSVLYHIIDENKWKESIAELSNMMKDDGHLLLRVNWEDKPLGSKENYSHFYDRPKESYLKEFNKNSLEIIDIVPLPVKPILMDSVSDLPSVASTFTKSLLAPLILRFDLFTNHKNRLLILGFKDNN